ncbi:MAG: glycoside hydrolase family 127 protein [Dysgonamonadaceae bacterium]|jgi:DUF1680 family protein|nr:glycoside hydrolase family 127 protein [Dysgonamonadaceae bacterium]
MTSLLQNCKNALYIVIFVLMLSACSDTDTNPPDGDETLIPIPFREVTLQDDFWLPRLKVQKQTLIPFALDKTRPAVENLKKTADYLKGIQGELPFPHRFIASDLYKVMEGAAYLLTLEKDTALERQMDEIIDVIADAQQEDGYHYESHITGVSKNAEHWGGGGMGDKPYSWVVHSHELYDMGHMYEGAVAYYQATGKDKWLNVATKNANHIFHVFFEGDPEYNDGKPVNQAPGHEEIELALVKLYRITGDSLYLNLAKRFIDIRGVTYKPEGEGVMAPEYAQQHLPVREQTKAVGHSVRAVYLYSGMADVSAQTGDTSLRPALDSIWHNIVDTRMHITGGLGAIHGIEGFGPEYLLPNKDAYNETCAAVGNVFFNHRMFLMGKDGKYMDVAEIALFNNVLAGVNLEGNKFFYVNPLEADGKTPFNHGRAGRSPWFGTACCPSNLARLIPQVPGLIYAHTSDEIYCSFYAGSTVEIPLKKGKIKVTQKTNYPFDEKIEFRIHPEQNKSEFTMRLRIPTWTGTQFVPGKLYQYNNNAPDRWEIRINGKKLNAPVKNGYISLRRKWDTNDKLELYLPMPVRYSRAIDEVEADRGRVTITRGPLVYCAEAVDNDFPVHSVYLDDMTSTGSIHHSGKDLFAGIDFIRIPAKTAGINENTPDKEASLTLIPYYAWDNRGDSAMIVWIPKSKLLLSEPFLSIPNPDSK